MTTKNFAVPRQLMMRQSLKSYQMLNAPRGPVGIGQAAQVAGRLKELGLVIVTVRFGDRPVITVKPSGITQRFDSVCTGQGGDAGAMYRSYATVVDGIKVVWHRPMQPLH